MNGRVFASLTLCLGSMAAGWILGRARLLKERQARSIIRLVVTWLAPLVLCLLFWGLDLSAAGQPLLPVIGLAISCAAVLPAWGYARAARLDRPRAGSFLTCAMFSNLGYLGSFVAFALHGEPGYGLAMLYLLFFTPAFYLFGFGIARRYGVRSACLPRQPQDAPDARRRQAEAVGAADLDTIRFLPFVGLVLGLGLNLSRLPRPLVCESVNHLLIPLETGLYLLAIGSQLHLPRPSRQWVVPVLVMCAIKFLFTPAVGWAVSHALGLEGLPRFVVLLQASMPVAISPLMLPMLFGLDRRLSGALWLCTTLAAVPWLLVYLPLITPW